VGHVACMGERRGAQSVLVRKPDRVLLEDTGIDGRIILKCIFRKWDGGMDRIDVAQNRDRWGAFVNAVMNLRVP